VAPRRRASSNPQTGIRVPATHGLPPQTPGVFSTPGNTRDVWCSKRRSNSAFSRWRAAGYFYYVMELADPVAADVRRRTASPAPDAVEGESGEQVGRCAGKQETPSCPPHGSNSSPQMPPVLKAHFDGKVLVPDEPVDLRRDCPLEVHVKLLTEDADGDRPLMKLAALLAQFPSALNAPTDGAAQHDHYLYGTPKRP
jgi:hypothetical protein